MSGGKNQADAADGGSHPSHPRTSATRSAVTRTCSSGASPSEQHIERIVGASFGSSKFGHVVLITA